MVFILNNVRSLYKKKICFSPAERKVNKSFQTGRIVSPCQPWWVTVPWWCAPWGSCTHPPSPGQSRSLTAAGNQWPTVITVTHSCIFFSRSERLVGRDSRCIYGNSQAQILSGNTATDWVGLYYQQPSTYIVCKQLQIEYIATAGSSHSKLPTDPGCDMGWVWQSSRLCILQLPGPKR